MTDRAELRRRIRRRRRRTAGFIRSVTAQLVVLLVVFAVVPVVIYQQFSRADEEKQALLLDTIRDEGLLISRALEMLLRRADSVPYVQLGEELARFSYGAVSLRLLFRPIEDGSDPFGFFYVASAPPVSTDDLAAEREHLIEIGVLDRLATSCAVDLPMASRVEFPDGRSEMLTSITPVMTPRGCWVMVVSKPLEALAGLGIDGPYWATREVQVAAAVYLFLAVVVLGLFFGLWRNLVRFGRLARGLGADPKETASFTERNTIPELSELAADFDRMVDTLRESAANIRRAAEETAHAFKTPLAVIRQALEPIQARIEPDDRKGRQASAAIAAATQKLEGLVLAVQRLESATADLLEAPRERLDLSAICRELADSYRGGAANGAAIIADVAWGIEVVGSAAAIETVIENLLDNAISFTPTGGAVRLSLATRGRMAVMTVEDEGPGVAPNTLDRIFERYYSHRPPPAECGAGKFADHDHAGIGLWIVRRNIEALGGHVVAENIPGSGLRMTVELPRA